MIEKKDSTELQKPSFSVDGELSTQKPSWWFRPLAMALVSGLLLWACFPPLGIWPLAWFAAAPLIGLMMPSYRVFQKRDYFKIWVGGFVHWMLLAYFVTLPHWAGYFGWVAMAAYLAIYFPLFVWFGRSMIRVLRIPVCLAAPIAWVAVDLIRAHLFTGFAMAMIPHSMFRLPVLIQTSDIAGAYGLSFLMVLVTACLVELAFYRIRKREFPVTNRFQFIRITICVLVPAFILGYGFWRLQDYERIDNDSPSLRVVLIQGSIDTIFPKTEAEADRYFERQLQQYRDLTTQARREVSDIDLLIWPESMFPVVYFEAKDEDRISEEAQNKIDRSKRNVRLWFLAVQGAAALPNEDPRNIEFTTSTSVLTGINILNASNDESYNGALLFDSDGNVTDTYYKNHRVPFGEYFPLGHLIPWVYDLMPIGKPLTPGERPEVFEFQGFKMAPNICFESTVPHLIRKQLNQLSSENNDPDVMVNVTNDGWFFGSNCLDLHLACNVFRSVEMRKPSLIAANTGFSGHVDSRGKLLQVGPRRKTGFLKVDLRKKTGLTSIYRVIGDIPAVICLFICLKAAVWSVWIYRRRRTKPN